MRKLLLLAGALFALAEFTHWQGKVVFCLCVVSLIFSERKPNANRTNQDPS
jgi:hypothetical protein